MNTRPESDRFNQKIQQLSDVFVLQRDEIRRLKAENKKLREQLEHIHKGQSDIFSHLADAERLKIKQQLSAMIAVLDQHIDEQP